jgi:hypothetical protein
MKAKRKPMVARGTRRVWVAAALITLFAASAQAGMTVYGLNDFYETRLQDISMFLVVLLLCSAGVMGLWNVLARDFKSLPRLKYRHAAALSVIFGLAMLLILTMISGIREVLTPEAWRKQGTAYKLNSPAMEEERRLSLARLRDALHQYAQTHDGRFPPHDFVPEITDKLWETVDYRRSRFEYQHGLTLADTNRVLAWEPERFGEKRFVLFVGGEIKSLTKEELASQLKDDSK